MSDPTILTLDRITPVAKQYVADGAMTRPVLRTPALSLSGLSIYFALL